MGHKVILLGLNEVNFEFVRYYVGQGMLPNLGKLLSDDLIIETTSEDEYELLEPWIQWVTLYTGKKFKDHRIFRLGDIVDHKELGQIFEELEDKGMSVGAVSPFNADNRLSNPAFFIPDPWTNTKVYGNWIVRNLHRALHYSVNNNAHDRLKVSTLASLGIGYLMFVPFRRWTHYISLIRLRNKPGVKSIILDSLLSDIFINLLKNKKPEFSHLFLNSGAHIQHHYMYNSKAYHGEFTNPEWYCPLKWDPLIEILKEYDNVVGKLLKLKNTLLVVATGLHQQPHNKLTYYWRLKKHEEFFFDIGLTNFKEVIPRMSRDFLITFDMQSDAKSAEQTLNSLVCDSDNHKIFNVDSRGTSLFVELVYSNELKEETLITSSIENLGLKPLKHYVSFVAIKNGEHNGMGYLTSSKKLSNRKCIQLNEVKDILIKEVLKT